MGWFKKYVVNPIKRAGKSIAKGFKKVVKGVGDFFTGAVNFVGGLFGFNMAPDPGDYDVGQQQGTTVTKTGGNFPIELVFTDNQINVGGNLVHMSSDGDKNRFLYLTYILGYGEVNTIAVLDEEWGENGGAKTTGFANWDSGNSSSGPENRDGQGTDFYTLGSIRTGTVQDVNFYDESTYYVQGPNKSFGRFYYHNGADEHANNRSVYAPDFHPDKAEYKGLAFIKMRLEFPVDEDTNAITPPFTGLPQFTFRISRQAQHRITKTRAVSPVNVLYDLLRNGTYGLGLSSIYIDSASFTALEGERFFDTHHYNVQGTTFRFDINQPVVANIKSLLYTMGCTLIWKDNKFFVKPNPQYSNKGITTDSDYNIQTHTIAEEDCIGGIAYEIAPADEKFKEVTITTFGQTAVENKIETVDDMRTQTLPTYVKNKLDTGATTKFEQSVVGFGNRRLSAVKLLESHYGSTVSITLGAKHSNIEVFDIINVDYARANLSGARYVVLDVEHTSLETVNVRAIRYLFDDDAEGVRTVDVIPKLLTHRYSTINDYVKKLVAVPTGFGLDSNTQVDRFYPQRRKPNQITALEITTSPEFFKRQHDSLGREVLSNRVKVSWTVTGDPNNTRFQIAIKKAGELVFDDLFETNQTTTFVEGLDDLAIYYIRVTPRNQTGTTLGRINKFTTLDSGGKDVTSSNKEFNVTDENGVGDAVETTGGTPAEDSYSDANNIFSSSYVNRTNRPLGHTADNFLQPGVTGYEETYEDLLTDSVQRGKCWNDFDYSANGGSGSRSDGHNKLPSSDGALSPDFTDSTYPSATEANFNARIGTWGGTAWTEFANGTNADSTNKDCRWLSVPASRGTTLLSAAVETVLVGGTEDTGASKDYWWEGRVEVAPDKVTSDFFTDPNAPIKKRHAFVYFHSDDTNDNITTFPYYDSPGSLASAGILTNYISGDSRLSAPGGITGGVDPNSAYTGNPATYTGGSFALPINTGRYVTPVFFFPDSSAAFSFGVRSYNFKVKSELYTHTFKNIDTSTLSGSSSARTFTFTTPRFGRIKDVIITATNSETNSVVGKLTSAPTDNTQSITFKVVRATDGAAVDATVDIFMAGFPEVIAVKDSGSNFVTEYRQNFEGTL